MPTQNVNVTDKIANFVHGQVQSGNFKNASEVHRAALIEMQRREEERGAVLTWLRNEAQTGFAQIEAKKCTTFRSVEELDSWMGDVLTQVISNGDAASRSDQDSESVA